MSMLNERLRKVSGIVWASVAIIIAFSLFAPGFLSGKNIELILKNSAILVVIGVGMTMAIISQQIDLSIGGTMTLAGLISAYYIASVEQVGYVHIGVALVIGILSGILVGVFNGLFIGIFRFNYWLVTFATMSITFGLAQGLSNGSIVSNYAKIFRSTLVSGTAVLGVSNLVWISLLIAIVMMVFMGKTRFGYHIYAIGDSEHSALTAGIDVKRVRMGIYMISGMLAGVGGVLMIAKTNSASAALGNGYEFDAIAACIVGGTSFEGGKGGLGGTVFGALILAAFKSGIQLIGLSNYWQKVAVGLFILAIIVADVLSSQKKRKEALRRIYK